MRTPTTILAGLVALGLCLVLSPAAQASITYSQIGSFGGEQIHNPIGIAVDQSGDDAYVASFFSHDGIQKFGAFGNRLAPPSPFGEAELFFGFSFFSGVAVSPVNGHVYVVDGYGKELQTYNGSSGSLLSQFSIAGSENLKFLGSIPVTDVQIASDAAGDVYLPNAPNNEVQEFSPDGAPLQTISGSGASALKEPTGVAVDSVGNIYVADTGNDRVEEFNPTGSFIRAIASPGVQAVAVDEAGKLYAGENSGSGFHVVVYDPTGAELAEFGAGTIGASAETIDTLAIGPTGLVYVTDGGNSVVWIYAEQREPSLENVSSFAVTQTSAILNATIDPNFADTTYHFEYGTSTAYGTSVPIPDADIGVGREGPVVVGQDLSGLRSGTTYHYRVVASNANNQVLGSDETFTTPPPQPPLVSTGQASSVTQSAVTLSATIDPHGFETTYEFDLGTDTGYGTRVFGDAGSQAEAQTFTLSLQDLGPATTYHYRIAATNIFGTSFGADQTFTTPEYPTSTLTAPVAPALLPVTVSALSAASSPSVKPVAHSAKHGKKKSGGKSKPDGKRPDKDRKSGSTDSGHGDRRSK